MTKGRKEEDIYDAVIDFPIYIIIFNSNSVQCVHLHTNSCVFVVVFSVENGVL